MNAICMTKEFWENSQLSVARFYGRCSIGGHEYIIVNKDGKDLFQCTFEAKKAGREKAIEPYEPADLVRKDFLTFYRKLGRDKFMEVLKSYGHHNDDKHLKEYMKLAIKDKKVSPICQANTSS